LKSEINIGFTRLADAIDQMREFGFDMIDDEDKDKRACVIYGDATDACSGVDYSPSNRDIQRAIQRAIELISEKLEEKKNPKRKRKPKRKLNSKINPSLN